MNIDEIDFSEFECLVGMGMTETLKFFKKIDNPYDKYEIYRIVKDLYNLEHEISLISFALDEPVYMAGNFCKVRRS